MSDEEIMKSSNVNNVREGGGRSEAFLKRTVFYVKSYLPPKGT